MTIHPSVQWLFLVPVKGGRWHINPQKATYTSGTNSLLGGYMLPTTFYMEPEITIDLLSRR